MFAVVTIAFWCQCRIGEVCVDHLFDTSINMSRSTPQKSGRTTSNITFHLFWEPHTKTKPRGEFIMWTNSRCVCSAQWAFSNHLRINHNSPPLGHLFAFEAEDGSFPPMRRTWFIAKCNDIWLSSSLGVLMGHSFCIGGTTHLLLMGVDLFIATRGIKT